MFASRISVFPGSVTHHIVKSIVSFCFGVFDRVCLVAGGWIVRALVLGIVEICVGHRLRF